MSEYGPERAKRSVEFGRLLSGAINSIATYEGWAAPSIERGLGELIGLSGASIQRYKRGHIPPEKRTVKMLAEAAVKRAFLSRRWLSRFLHTAGYPDPDEVLDELCPATLVDPTNSALARHNLPPPRYTQFVMRPKPFGDVQEALRQRTAVVVIYSLGGMGKSSLAREVAFRCIQPDAQSPTFDCVVWVSDAEHPGFTNLNVVLDEIARTLGYESLLDRNEDDKRRGIEQALRSQRVLVVIDNFETIGDNALLRWLLKLPEPSKVLITTREYRREYRQGAWPIELSGLTDDEASEFVNHRLRQVGIDHLVQDRTPLKQLVEVTGGNPKAMELALGNLKYAHHTLQQVVDDLRTARGEIFELLFESNWSLLDEAARRILLAATLFHPSANPEALSASADVRSNAFSRALEQLADLSMLDIWQENIGRSARYALHPLVRAFATAELRKDPDLELAAHNRALDWLVRQSSKVGYCRNDLSRLAILDPEREVLHDAIGWAHQQGKIDKVLQLTQGAGYFCYVRGLLNREPNINLLAAEAAHALEQPAEELRWLSYHVQRLARIGNVADTHQYVERMQTIVASHDIAVEGIEAFRHALAIAYFAASRIDLAEQEWRALIDLEGLGQTTRLVTVKWLAICLELQGQTGPAAQLLQEAIATTEPEQNPRAYLALNLACLRMIMSDGECGSDIENRIRDCRQVVVSHGIDRHIPDVLFLEGRLSELRNERSQARAAYSEAVDHYRRVGLQHELNQAEKALRRISIAA
ncbi:MAG: NB-ARC domain-containing protein [Chloroflexi bacterium]|nr:NB-ARC domain-containing protein [Chloroflexota bacterium]